VLAQQVSGRNVMKLGKVLCRGAFKKDHTGASLSEMGETKVYTVRKQQFHPLATTTTIHNNTHTQQQHTLRILPQMVPLPPPGLPRIKKK
jgi:hypothetical protein